MVVLPPALRLATKQRQYALALDRVRNLGTSQLQERRHDVLPPDHLRDLPVALSLQAGRHTHNKGNARRCLEPIGLPPEVVIPEHLTMVGCEQQEGVPHPASIHHIHQPPNLRVQVGQVGVVRRPGPMVEMVGYPAPPAVGVQRVARLLRVPLRPLAHSRHRQVSIDELVVVDLRRAPGRMGAVE